MRFRKASLVMILLWIGIIIRGQEIVVDEMLERIMAVEYQREIAPLREAPLEGSGVFVDDGEPLLHTGAYSVTSHKRR